MYFIKNIFELKGKYKDDFYQSKYEYYKKFNLGALAASSFAFIILIIVDWQISNSLNWGTVLCRFAVLIPLAAITFAYFKTTNYKIMATISFAMVHAIIWCNVWITSTLRDMSHANDGFIFMGFLLLLVSFSSPLLYSFIAQWGLVWDIIISDKIFHYNDFSVMVSFNCQVVILLNLINIIIGKVYYDQYINRKKLDLALLQDPLTQVYNRNKLNNLITINNDLTYISNNISILIIDIDHFKVVNDTYGHNEGDHILQFIAQSIKSTVRKQDIVIRWGGEEFIVILINCTLEGAVVNAEMIRKNIAAADNGICKVTVSIGVAKHDGGNCFETIKNADNALYQAKREGRNKVVCYEK
jgi:diguanylate cyclase (GGDEF) domain